jgi:hypothetical protein
MKVVEDIIIGIYDNIFYILPLNLNKNHKIIIIKRLLSYVRRGPWPSCPALALPSTSTIATTGLYRANTTAVPVLFLVYIFLFLVYIFFSDEVNICDGMHASVHVAGSVYWTLMQ